MTLSHFFLILCARWRSAVLTVLATLAAVLLGCLVWPNQYTATAAVVLDIRTPDPIAGVVQNNSTVSNYMATQVDVVQSERVALKALHALRLPETAPWRERWLEDTGGHGEFEAWLVERLSRPLTVRPSRDSNVISIGYSAPDAGFAASMANAFMKAYVDTTLELRVEPARQYNSFFDERARAVREALEQAQAKLSAYQRDKGLLATDEKLDVENERLSALSAQMVALQGVAAETGGRQAQAGSNGERLQEVLTNPLVTALTADLSRDEAQLQQLSQRLGDQHPQVIELRATIAELRSRVDAATSRVKGSVGLNNSVNQSRLTQLQAELDAQRTKVLHLKGLRDEAQVLQRDVENAQKAYEAVMAHVSQSDMESQNTQTNVSVLKRASVPAFPSSPRIVLSAAVALTLGVLLALAVVVLRERVDRRLRTDDEVMSALGAPLLVKLPVAKSALPSHAPKRLPGRAKRLLSGLPAATFR
jgi:succinoglycan biosynthesis transport protein ExoP